MAKITPLQSHANDMPQRMTEQAVRQNLAAAYRLFAHFGMDDLTYTHLSARVPGEEAFFIYPFGMLFEEVRASDLLKVSLEGEILEGEEYQYNRTGFVIHGSIYQAKPDINAIYHLHTQAGVAVSALKDGLLPLSQFAYHFQDNVGYYDYDSLALDYDQHGDPILSALGNNSALFLRNHGTLTVGHTIQEAFFYMYYLEQACQTQIKILSMNSEVEIPSEETCKQARKDMRDFEPDLGTRDWQALLRLLERQESDYQE